MRFPLEPILDLLAFRHPTIRLARRDLWIKGAYLMPRDIRLIDPDKLYFCMDADHCPLPGTAPYILASPDEEALPDNENCVILPYGTDIVETFNDVISYLSHLHDWLREVEVSVSKNEGVQALVDLSEKILGNPVVVITPAFRVVAATWNLESSDRVFSDFLNLGYLSAESWNRLRDNDYYRTEYYTGKTVILPPSSIKDYTSTLTAVVHNTEVAFLILMLCSNFEYTSGVAQIFGYIQDKLLHYLQPLADSHGFSHTQFDSFIIELIEGRSTTPKEIYERSSVFGRTYSKAFHTVLIQLEQPSEMFLAHEVQTLELAFPEVYILAYKDRIIMHFERRPGGQDIWFEQLSRLNAILEDTRAHAGVSEPLTGFENIRESFRQADVSLEFGIRMLGRSLSTRYLGEEQELARIFSFGNYQVFSMLTGKETEAPLLSRIRQFDAEHGTDYHRILFVYLSTDRNFTHAAKILHMHRNNVVYHINRISDFFNLDLDRPTLRLRLLMLYRLEDIFAK